MDKTSRTKYNLSSLNGAFLFSLFCWSITVGVMFYINIHQLKSFTIALAKDNALAVINRDMSYRLWGAKQGGVYVKPSEYTPPNQYLKVPNRDINSTNGIALTLVNPAYMTRQVAELANSLGDSKLHLTSLKPIRPQNKPDEWEFIQLKLFEQGVKESFAIVDDNTKIRVMKPFVAEKPCLQCHLQQGYKIGDIRGGISVTVELSKYKDGEALGIRSLAISYISIWIIGVIATVVGYFLISKNMHRLERARDELNTLNIALQDKIEEETAKRLQNERMLAQQSKLAMMGEMISMIAHQWRQPLNSLAISVQDIDIAHQFGEIDDAYMTNFRNRSMNVISHMSTTINDFSNFFKPSKEKECFCVEEAVNQTINMISPLLNNNEITTDRSQVEKHAIKGYKNEFEQVLMIIISNAKDVLISNNIENPRIAIAVKSFDDDNISIEIEDNGGGVADDIVDRVFEPYFTTKDQGQGTGIGLYMAKEIIERQMGGRLSVHNGEYGAVFTIILKKCECSKIKS